ncbi:MAG TPA: TetR/AcrR family transcriptional regulator [Bacillota bacterium]|nr:TetR/AcrR family transcriptional regulator [Bacillota bacterium]
MRGKVITSVKDTQLIEKRREQIVKAAISLFKNKGFHKTTTREIAKESGFSIGTLYEYIRQKEDILFLVCEAIHNDVDLHLKQVIDLENPSIDHLITVVKSYFQLMDEMQDEVIVMYQEIKSLEEKTRTYILQKEREMIQMLKQVIVSCTPHYISEMDAELLANNIFVQGQMWGFRRWALHQQFTLESYTERQIQFLLKALSIDTDEVDV